MSEPENLKEYQFAEKRFPCWAAKNLEMTQTYSYLNMRNNLFRVLIHAPVVHIP